MTAQNGATRYASQARGLERIPDFVEAEAVAPSDCSIFYQTDVLLALIR